jgi:hypothetical protein
MNIKTTAIGTMGGAVDGASSQRLIVVSYLANAPFPPRGVRTQALLEALQREWSIELIAAPSGSSRGSTSPQVSRSVPRKILRLVHSSILLDKYEPWSRRRFRSWRPEAAGALLIGFPFSPLVYASRRLVESGIPYVVDAGDPWVLTNRWPEVHTLGLARARAAERRLWAGAAGAILTTEAQAGALRAIFPELEVLVRANGFAPVAMSRSTTRLEARRRGHDVESLRLAHFGDISSDRLNIESFLKRLARSGLWSEIEFHQYGSDWTGTLKAQREVKVVFHEPRQWAEIVRLARAYDLAVVLGNRDPTLLPSKAVAYLQLPIPRLALVKDGVIDALTQYVAAQPGWIVLDAHDVGADDAEAAKTIHDHVSRGWTTAELAPPAAESWDHVAKEVAQFLRRVLNIRVPEVPPVADL